jgi:ABC-type sugar transport system ATPase subunit
VRKDFTNAERQVLLKAQGICIKGFPDSSIDFQLTPGEIVALAGPVGSGKEALAMALAGQEKINAGAITSDRANFPDIGFVPNDRHISGYVGLLGVRENVSIGGLDILSRKSGFINLKQEESHVGKLVAQTNVITSSIEKPVSQLSGGNQQKVVFARSLCRDPNVIVAMSPTRGVDVGAKEQLYALLRTLASEGRGIVVVSDEEDEIEQLANRVVIVFEGKVVDQLVGDYSMKDLVLHMEGVA